MPLEPCALTIGGLDPSGGAGVFADLRAFAAASVWGCGAVAVVTVQSTAGLRSSHPIDTKQLLDQVREIARHQRVRAVKIGALGSASNVRGIARWLATLDEGIPIVLDPVLQPTRRSGRARLLEPGAVPILLGAMKRVTLITPNVPEAETLLHTRIRSLAQAEQAARELVARGARAALVKGGHLRTSANTTTDVLAIRDRIVRFEMPRVDVAFHGTGCTLASLIAGRLAKSQVIHDDALVAAVRWAKGKLQRALSRSIRIGDGLSVIDP